MEIAYRTNLFKRVLNRIMRVWIRLGLPPGKYTLSVKGSNNHGVWNEDGLEVRIAVVPPWWQTWWARVGYAVGKSTVPWPWISYS